jgi:hypothetical protein
VHWQGDHASNDPDIGRHCVHPWDLDGRLSVLTEDGECRMYDDGSGVGVKRGVTVWTSNRTMGTRPWEASSEARTASAPGAEDD